MDASGGLTSAIAALNQQKVRNPEWREAVQREAQASQMLEAHPDIFDTSAFSNCASIALGGAACHSLHKFSSASVAPFCLFDNGVMECYKIACGCFSRCLI